MNKYITEKDWYSIDNSIINEFARKIVRMFKEQNPAIVERDFISLEWQADNVFLDASYSYKRNPVDDDIWNIRNMIEYDWSNWTKEQLLELENEYKNVLNEIKNVLEDENEAFFINDNWLTYMDIETEKMLFHRN